ncbi:hypothetical protein Anapl_15563 [Anas platyrhynchos]|uniref:Uncharacterized protein n=1 Tax=Anas platyrhynchos TaxID=8839 RepID=R0LBM0_ANAPL|nr:hypothetical protein Anapl_15563 [Anas platyrhynchos]
MPLVLATSPWLVQLPDLSQARSAPHASRKIRQNNAGIPARRLPPPKAEQKEQQEQRPRRFLFSQQLQKQAGVFQQDLATDAWKSTCHGIQVLMFSLLCCTCEQPRWLPLATPRCSGSMRRSSSRSSPPALAAHACRSSAGRCSAAPWGGHAEPWTARGDAQQLPGEGTQSPGTCSAPHSQENGLA